MPVEKERKYEIAVKNLRRREIPCLVIAVPKKNDALPLSETCSSSAIISRQDKNCSKILKRLKQRLYKFSKTSKKSKSLSSLDMKTELSQSKVTKKKVYRKRSLQPPASVRKKNSVSSDSELNLNKSTSIDGPDIPKKRVYRKKSFQESSAVATRESPTSVSGMDLDYSVPVLTRDTPAKRVYRKKITIPAVPHNTPVLCTGSDGDSTCNSFLSQSTTTDVIVIKRGRGRPRLTLPTLDETATLKLDPYEGEESTVSIESGSSTSKRFRRSPWLFDSDGEDPVEEEISEYELLRQRNIEENLKKLRELFNEQGLEFEEKPSETPKKRKNYSRLPLPPPRPKSQRIEIRQSPLDFSKLEEKLTLSETSFNS